jgi:nuclease (SNase domain protein)
MAEDNKQTPVGNNKAEDTSSATSSSQVKNPEPKKGSKEAFDAMVNDTHMSLPELSDFEEGTLDMRVYQEMAKKFKNKEEQALFYKENPPLENTGIDKARGLAMVSLPSSAFRINEEDMHAGFVDGDTLYADLRKAKVSDPELLEFLTRGQQNMRAWLANQKTNTEDVYDANKVKDENYSIDYDMGFRFLFYDAPEVYHWSIVYATDVIKTTYGEAVNKYKAFVVKNKMTNNNLRASTWESVKDTDECTIAQIGEFDNKWIQVNTELTNKRFNNVDITYLNGRQPVFGLMADGTNSSTLSTAYRAATQVVDMIKKAEEIKVVIDINGSSKQDQTTQYPKNFLQFNGDDLLANFLNSVQKAISNQDPTIYQETGINMYGLEHYRRNLAVVYVKHNGQWINLNKYIIANNPSMSILKYSDFTNPNMKPWSYQFDKMAYADAYWNVKSQLDNRHEIQNAAFQTNNITKNLQSLKDWTCTIGDVTLFVPPISIKTVTQAYTNSVPLMRAKGSANIENAKPERFLQLELYFNDDRGINGQSVKWKTNTSSRGKEVVYHMNGFRALLSEFHFAPYMPIENEYINNVLDIDAICFESMAVATVPNYPKLLKVTLLLKEFDYQVFMPQVPKWRDFSQSFDEPYRNMFATTINYDLLRWYYQKPLQLGNELHDKKFTIMSKEFMKRTLFANRTALMPVDTLNPRINIYIPDEGKLVKMEKVRQSYPRTNKKVPNYYRPSSKDKDLFEQADNIYKLLYGTQISNTLKSKTLTVDNKLSQMAEVGQELVKYLNNFNIPATYNVTEAKYTVGQVLNAADNFVPNLLSGGQIKPVDDLDNPYADQIVLTITPSVLYNSYSETTLLRQQFASTLSNANSNNMSTTAKNTNPNGLTQNPINTDIYDSIFTHNQFKIKIIAKLDGNKIKLEFYRMDKDSKFLEYCASQHANQSNSTDAYTANSGNEQTYEEYEDSEFERITSIDYKLYLEDVLVQGITANFNNTFANMTLNTYHGQAPQYMGGQDANVTFSILTSDKEIIDAFDKIPKIISYFKKQYPNALPSYPFRIESEFTKLLGIHEVIIEQVAISSVENYPGLFQINVTLKQTDRTIRNRFAVYKQFELTKDASERATEKRAEESVLSYFQIDSNLAKAELYPDLELPTIDELGKEGFEFIRYKNPRDQVFVDPDFYYCYQETLFSELLRDMVLSDSTLLKAFKKKADGDKSAETASYTELISKDSEGLRVDYGMLPGMIVDQKSPDFMKTVEQLKELDTKISDLKKEENEVRTKLVKSGMLNGQWKVGKSIGVTFMEPYYSWLYNNLKSNKDILEKAKTDLDKAKNIKPNNPNDPKDPEVDNYGGSALDYSRDKNGKLEQAQKDTQAKIKELGDNKADNALKSVLVDSIDNFHTVADKILDYLSKTAIEDKDSEASLRQQFYNLFVETKVVQNDLDSWRNNINTMLNSFALAGIYSGIEEEYDPENNDAFNKIKSFLTNTVNSTITTGNQRVDQVTITSGAENRRIEKEIDQENTKKLTDKKYNDVSKYLAPSIYTENNINYFVDKDNIDSFYKYGSLIQMGPFRISCFTKDEFEKNRLLHASNIDYVKRRKKFIDDKKTFLDSDHYYFIDPYYQTSDYKETIQYMRNCMTDYNYAKNAFLRNILFWLCVLIKNDIYPNYMTDIMFQNATSEASAYQFMKDMKLATNVQQKNIDTLKNFVKDNQDKYLRGKLFVGTLLALMSKNQGIIDSITKRDYNALNALTHKVLTPNLTVAAPLTQEESALRKLLLSLIPAQLVDKVEELGIDISGSNPIAQISQEYMQQLELEENSNSPESLARRVRDMFLDMIKTDVRGRMLRGFPTFYMAFIDEGLTSGFWKMHDSFYSTNAISSIQVVKSKNIAADTAIIQLNNLYQNILQEYDNDGDDDNFVTQIQNGVAGIKNLYESIFNPRTYVRKASEKQALIPERASIKLVAGARVHLRIGYGADASKLPSMFNGTITSIEGDDVVNVIAQSDGIELSNPIREDNFGDRIKNRGIFYLQDSPYGKSFGGVSPRVLISSFMTCNDNNSIGKYTREKNWNILSRIFSSNPFGIYHFGDVYFNDIFINGEPVQNIYEVTNDGSAHYYNKNYADSGLTLEKENTTYGQGDQSTFSQVLNMFNLGEKFGHQFIDIKTQGRTVWDILQFSASAEPTYIGAIAPFGFRSTVFLGKPNWYYAYKYIKRNNNYSVIERRKPYEQIHMYWSDHDIISNQIQTNVNKVGTVAKGLYQFEDVKKSTPDIYFDRDIYPEYQRSMVVDTWLYGRSQLQTSSDNTFGIDSEIGSLDNYATVTGAAGATIGGVAGGYLGAAGGSIGVAGGAAIGSTVLGLAGSALELGVKRLGTWAVSNFAPDGFGGDEHNHAITARNMTLSRLKKSVEQIYMGNLVVYGDPSVKPHDRISINDGPSSMTGQAKVREVVHTLSVQSGFVTTITPDAIVDPLNDQTTRIVNTSILSTLFRYSVYAITLHNLSHSLLVKSVANDAMAMFRKSKFALSEASIKKLDELSNVINIRNSKRLADINAANERLTKINRILGKNESRINDLFAKLETATDPAEKKSILENIQRLRPLSDKLKEEKSILESTPNISSAEAKAEEAFGKSVATTKEKLKAFIKEYNDFEENSAKLQKQIADIYETDILKEIEENGKKLGIGLEKDTEGYKELRDKYIQSRIAEDAKNTDLKEIKDADGKVINVENSNTARRKALSKYGKYIYEKEFDDKRAVLMNKYVSAMAERDSVIDKIAGISNTKKGASVLEVIQKEKGFATLKPERIAEINRNIIQFGKVGEKLSLTAKSPWARALQKGLSFGTRIGGNVVTFLAAYMLGTWGDMIKNYIDNYKTLCVTPLLKRGVPFIPNFSGNSGTIYLSPNWGKRGPVLDAMDSLFNHRIFGDELSDIPKGIGSFMLNMLLGGGPGDAIQKFQENADGMLDAHGGSDYDYLSTQGYIDTLFNGSSIRSVEQLIKRLKHKSEHGNDVDKDKHRIQLTANMFMHPYDLNEIAQGQFDPLTPVPGPEFDVYKQFKFLVIRHERALYNEERSKLVQFSVQVANKPVIVNGLKAKDGSGNKVLDAPLLHPFALNTFRKIIVTAESMLSYKITADHNTYINKVSNDYITLASCYLFGTDKIYAGSGFGFTLIPHGESVTNLEQVLIVMKQNQELDFASYDANGDKAFMINVNIPSTGV